MFDKKYSYAVIGASNNIEKYGYKIFKYLLDNGADAVAVNHKEEFVLEHNVYKSITQLPNKKRILIFVVPPSVTNEILQKTNFGDLGVVKLWFQPGSHNEQTEQLAKNLGLPFVNDACIMRV